MASGSQSAAMLPSSTLKRKRSSFISPTDQTIVTLKVGRNATPYNVHRELLCNVSQYFRGAFKGSFKEAGDRTIAVDTNVKTWQIIMRWLYSQRLENVDMPKDDKPEWSLTRGQLLDLYVFGDQYNVPELRNEAMRYVQMQYCSGCWRLPLEYVPQAFGRLPATSPFCRWLIQYFAHTWDPEKDADEEALEYEKLPHEFLLGVTLVCRKRLTRLRQQRIIEETDGAEYHEACHFHEHEDDESYALCAEQTERLRSLTEKVKKLSKRKKTKRLN